VSWSPSGTGSIYGCPVLTSAGACVAPYSRGRVAASSRGLWEPVLASLDSLLLCTRIQQLSSGPGPSDSEPG